MNLIDKDALIAEIESKKKYAQILGDNAINSSMQQFYDGMKQGCIDILSFLNTLEVKEVDLEKEIDNVWNPHFNLGWNDSSLVSINHKSFETITKHFYELGLKATQKGE